MPVLEIKDFKFKPLKDGVRVAKIDWFKPCEALIYKYPKGYSMGFHKHSGSVLQVVLKGRIKFSDKSGLTQIGGPHSFHKCVPFDYNAKVLIESYVLIVQKPGTKVVLN